MLIRTPNLPIVAVIWKPEDLDKLGEFLSYLNTKLGVANSKPGNSNNYKVNPVTKTPVNPKTKNTATGSVKSLSIVHPVCRLMDISSICIVDIKAPVYNKVGKMTIVS